MKNVIIAEKNSVAADLAKALGKFKKMGGYFERDDLIIVGAVGHLLMIKPPPGHEKEMPVIPPYFDLVPIAKTADKLALIVSLIGRRDVGTIINCCDAGREGELIFRYIYSHSGTTKPIKRMWLQSMTPNAVVTGYTELKDGAQFDALYDAALCRSESDWLIGINASRVVTWFSEIMLGARDKTTAGRVQTPVLTIVVDRENAINAFVPRPYWEVMSTFRAAGGDYVGKWVDPDFIKTEDDDAHEDRFFDSARAADIVSSCQGGKVEAVVDVAEEERKLPPRLFDLTTLQREANRKFGFTASQTLALAQSLYETHKVLTYPRTDATVLPEDYLDNVKEVFFQLGGKLTAHAANAMLNGYLTLSKRLFDDEKISDHFAIIPTDIQPNGLSDDEEKIYELVARRFVAAFYPSALFKKTVRKTTVDSHIFKSHGTVLVTMGWLEVYEREIGGANELAIVRHDELPEVVAVESRASATKSPKRFTEDTLLGAMEGAGRFVADEEQREALKEKGLGTPATRAAIIEGLMAETEHRGPYCARDGKEIVPTAKAMSLIPLLRGHAVDELCSPAMTAEWEMRLRQMEKGNYSKANFMAEITAMVIAVASKLKTEALASPQYAALKLAAPCPKCGGEVREESHNFACRCGFRIGRKICEREMTRAEVTAMLQHGRTILLRGFSSKTTGAAFDAFLSYSKTENKINFVFPRPGEHDGICPKCSEGQLKSKAGSNGPFWYCSRWNATPKCDASYKDDDGQPLVVAPIQCPKCKTGRLSLVKSKFWACSNYRNDAAKCTAVFEDKEGRPDTNPESKVFNPFKKGKNVSAQSSSSA